MRNYLINESRGTRLPVTCSCGESTFVAFDESLPSLSGQPGGRYVAEHPGWKFRRHVGEGCTGLNGGWYCGKKGHFQQENFRTGKK